jgi:hypothetical protein
MTLDEAIKHAEEVADGHDRIKQIKAVTLEECKCAAEHRQLAEWLKDYERLLEQKSSSDAISRKAVLDEIDTYINKAQSTGTQDAFYSFAELVVKELPSVVSQSKTDVGGRSMTLEEKEQVGKYVLQMANFLADGCYQQEMLLKAAHIIDEALEQEYSGDTISRKAVVEQINSWNSNGEYSYTNATYYLMKRIRDIPSVTPQPKIGRWINGELIPNDITGHWYAECSECGKVRIVDNYCPNCGAKME